MIDETKMAEYAIALKLMSEIDNTRYYSQSKGCKKTPHSKKTKKNRRKNKLARKARKRK